MMRSNMNWKWADINFASFVVVMCFLLLHSYKNSNSPSSIDSNLRSRAVDLSDLSIPPIKHGLPRKCDAPTDYPDSYLMSQYREDQKLMELFGTICGGTYLEVGVMNGMKYSNSYVFNKVFGWRGILLELRKDLFTQLVTNRPDEIALINAGVCDKPQTLHAVYSSEKAVGGIYEYAAPSFKEQWWAGIDLENDPRVMPFECDTLDNLLLMNAPDTTHFDFFSLDVVGGELAALRSIDFDRIRFGIILVATDDYSEIKNLAMRQLLLSKGYSFISEYEHSYWFANVDFDKIYHDLMYDV